MEKTKRIGKVVSQEKLTDDICSMWIQADEIAAHAKPGQFISVYTKDAGKLLPRPISLCEVDKENGKGKIIAMPTREDIDFEIDEQLIVELYSK